MIVKEIICDRCGGKIEDKKPARIQIQEYDYTESKSYGRYAKGYRTAKQIHLCDTCNYCFGEFMNHKPLTSPEGVK